MRKRETARLTEALADVIWELGARGLDGVCCAELSLVEFHALRRLQGAGYLSVQALGAFAGLTKSGATRLVDRLADRGFLQRERSADDGRMCCVTLTAGGEEALAEARAAFAARLEEVLRDLDEEGRTQVLAVLPRLAAAVRRRDGGACCGPAC